MNAPRTEHTAANARRATEILEQEHVVISSVVDSLIAMSRRIKDGGDVPVQDARDAARFMSDFADGAHHEKEERLLFPAMEAAGLPPHAGPTSVMREEHEAGRRHVRAMTAALDASPADLDTFAQHAGAFAHLLRDHITKENQVLFPMADQLLRPDVQSTMLVEFQAQDPAIVTYWAEIAARLTLAYGD
jgi:hemerythrin-like domain-containing protein